MILRKDSKPYKILKCLLLCGGFLLLSSISPKGGSEIITGIIKNYFYKKRFEREKFLRDLKSLQVRELVNYKESPNGEIELILTTKGKNKILTYNIDDIKLNTKKRWDGQWRMVMFDIPHNKKKARDAFRQKLTTLGFYPIQKSVFITPHECENEIDFICSIFDIRKHILIFYIKNFEGAEKLRHHFGVC